MKNKVLDTRHSSIKYREWGFAILMIMFGAFIIISPQLFKHSIILGYDSNFHMNRIYDIAMQIQNGKYNYFQSIYGFQSSGRIINAVYGPDFAFILGCILLFAKNWFRFQLITSFLCLSTAGLTMYSLGRFVKIKSKLSLMMALLYMSTTTVSYFILWQTFSSWGAAFLPLVFIPAIKMIQDTKNPIHPVVLSLPVLILLNIHVFSFVLAVMVLIPFFLIGLYRTQNKLKMIIDTCFSVIITILLSSRLLAGMFEVFSTNQLYKPYLVEKMMNNTMRFSLEQQEWMKLGLIFSSLFIFMFVITLMNWHVLSLNERVINCVGLFFLLLSSPLLPWDDLPRIIKGLQTIQFPQRFISVAFILLLLGFTLFIQNCSVKQFQNRKFFTSLYLFLAIFSCLNMNQLVSNFSDAWHSNDPMSNDTNSRKALTNDPNEIRNSYSGTEPLGASLNLVIKPMSDYLPAPKDQKMAELLKKSPYATYWEEIATNNSSVEKRITKNGEIEVNWTNQQQVPTEKLLPVIAYANSTLNLNGKQLTTKEFSTSTIGTVSVKGPPGENSLIIGYQPSSSFIFAKYLQTFAYFCLFAYLIFILFKINKQRSKINK